MKILNVIVTNKIATYQTRCGDIVCGNNDYQINFTFDSEWDAFSEKTARFIVNGRYTDVDFTGTTCTVPIITNTDKVTVGVYAGDLCTTTSATIYCKPSILCGSTLPSQENDRNYANEAKEAAERAAEDAREEVTRLVGEIGIVQTTGDSTVAAMSQKATTALYNRNDKRITNLEQGLPEDNFITDDSVAYVKDVPSNALPYAEVKNLGGMTYKEGNTLKHAKVTEIKSVGKNLADIPNITVSGVGSWTSKKVGDFLLPNGNYVLSCDFEQKGDTSYVTLSPRKYGTNEQIAYGGTTNVSGKITATSFTITDDCNGGITLFAYSNESGNVLTTECEFKNIQIEKGTVATEFKPYAEHTIEIPSAVQALDGYGVGVNDEYYNYIDWDKKVFVKRVERIEFDGTENWGASSTDKSGVSRLFLELENESAITSVVDNGALGNLYPSISAEDTWFNIEGITTQRDILYVFDTEYCDSTTDTLISEWLSHLATLYANGNPLIVEYPLLTPIETDISHLITADNFIGVEGSGTITAVNENSLAVPSEIEYQVEV